MVRSPANADIEISTPFLPSPYVVLDRRPQTPDVVTLSIEPLEGQLPRFRAGQFNMLTVFGVGEAAISMSSPPRNHGAVEHTVRDVGAVTHALCTSPVGSVIGVRGPFGTDWGVDEIPSDQHVMIVAGGIGLAPLRGAIEQLVGSTEDRRIVVLVGARSPDQVVYGEDMERWRAAGARVDVTVDIADPTWPGHVGVVTSLIRPQLIEPDRTTVLVCGPEVMMRLTARALVDNGLAPTRIRVSLERNMQCGIGLCGHCQLGPYLLCRDGPVLEYGETLSALVTAREI